MKDKMVHLNPKENLKQPPDSHPEIQLGKLGVLLVNLGTPDNCDTPSVRRYLAEFLSDQRVIELTPWLWQPILHTLILRTRPAKSAKAYAKIWLTDPSESPLMRYTRQQAEKLKQQFSTHPEVIIDWAMRYGNPGLSTSFQKMQQLGCDKILIAPLYPQYSASTTASVIDIIAQCLKKLRWQPSIRTLPPYYDAPVYISALAQSIETSLAKLDAQPEVILASFHGVPQSFLTNGDPYYCQCVKTIRRLRTVLKKNESELQLVFQSRFGPKDWLKPYASEIIEKLAKQGVKRVAVVTPGFSVDCLETLEEMGILNQQLFLDNGGQQYTMIPCLNDSELSINMLKSLVKQELAGWLK